MMLSPRDRRWAAMVEDLPQRLQSVALWQGWRDPQGSGQLHHVPTLVVVVSGSVRLCRGRESLPFSAGQAVLIAPGVWHDHEAPRGDSAVFMQGLLPRMSDLIFWDAEGQRYGGVPLEPSQLLLQRAVLSADPAQRLGVVRELLRAVLQEDIQEPPAEHEAVQRMLHALWRGIHLAVTADDLVRASGLGHSQAYHLFKRAVGLSPQQAILKARLELANALIESGLSPAAAARQAGFSEVTSFMRRRRLQRDRN